MKLHKKFLSILLAIITILTLPLCSCKEKCGTVCNLETAYYKKGLITYNDLLDIAYYGTGNPITVGTEINGDIEYNKIYIPEKPKPVLSETMRLEIASAYFDYCNSFDIFNVILESNPYLTKDIIINQQMKIEFFGEYNGCYVFGVDCEYTNPPFSVPPENIDNVYLSDTFCVLYAFYYS